MSVFPPLQISQIAEAMHGQSIGVLHTLIGKPLDVPRKPTPRRHVQLVPGHAAVNLDRAGDRLGDVLYLRHDRLTCGRRPRSPLHWTGGRQSATNGGMEKYS